MTAPTVYTGRGGQDFLKLSLDLRKAADRDLRLAVYKSLRESAMPLGKEVVQIAAENGLPRRGGLALKVEERAKIGVQNALATKNARVLIKISGFDFRSMDRGYLRHPVFGNRKVWVSQRIRPGLFTAAFDKHAMLIRSRATHEAQRVFDRMSRSF